MIQAAYFAATLRNVHQHFTVPISTSMARVNLNQESPFRKFATACEYTPDAAKSLRVMKIGERLLAGDMDVIVHN